MKMKKFFVALIVLMGFSILGIGSTQAQAEENIVKPMASERIIIIHDKLLDTQYTCSSGSTYKRQYREKKYILEKYNSSGTVISSQIITDHYFTPYTLVGSGCKIPARTE